MRATDPQPRLNAGAPPAYVWWCHRRFFHSLPIASLTPGRGTNRIGQQAGDGGGPLGRLNRHVCDDIASVTIDRWPSKAIPRPHPNTIIFRRHVRYIDRRMRHARSRPPLRTSSGSLAPSSEIMTKLAPLLSAHSPDPCSHWSPIPPDSLHAPILSTCSITYKMLLPRPPHWVSSAPAPRASNWMPHSTPFLPCPSCL